MPGQSTVTAAKRLAELHYRYGVRVPGGACVATATARIGGMVIVGAGDTKFAATKRMLSSTRFPGSTDGSSRMYDYRDFGIVEVSEAFVIPFDALLTALILDALQGVCCDPNTPLDPTICVAIGVCRFGFVAGASSPEWLRGQLVYAPSHKAAVTDLRNRALRNWGPTAAETLTSYSFNLADA